MGIPFEVGDHVLTKKQHPCGGNEWEILRIGADIKLKCITCGRIIMLDLETCQKRVKKRLPKL